MNLDLATGRTGWRRPVDLSGSDPKAEQQSGTLTLLGSRLFVPEGSQVVSCRAPRRPVPGRPPP